MRRRKTCSPQQSADATRKCIPRLNVPRDLDLHQHFQSGVSLCSFRGAKCLQRCDTTNKGKRDRLCDASRGLGNLPKECNPAIGMWLRAARPTPAQTRHGLPNHPRFPELEFDTFGGANAEKFPET